jgi:hypothetical protein
MQHATGDKHEIERLPGCRNFDGTDYRPFVQEIEGKPMNLSIVRIRRVSGKCVDLLN